MVSIREIAGKKLRSYQTTNSGDWPQASCQLLVLRLGSMSSVRLEACSRTCDTAMAHHLASAFVNNTAKAVGRAAGEWHAG
mmetsp:Transcript_40972/g.80863  ORF Transcript_40972/g.80863 Transcript_40972/m.80863 type:complete len:81 (+) Transcript_40972:1574-1816(+)